jgi:tRNA-modifying protein YgfZ
MSNLMPNIQSKNTYFEQKNIGVIKISGKDRINFIQRQTTNDVRLLSITNPITTVLTNPAGRVLDILECINLDDISFLCIVYYPGKTIQFLKNKIFFMDKVEIEDVSLHFNVIDIFPINEQFLPKEIFQPDSYKYINSNKATRVLIESENYEKIISHLTANKFTEITEEEYSFFRVQNVIPAPLHEIIDKYTPLEINLKEYVSNSKGCYTGQEVIARQINLNKITKKLSGFEFSGKITLGDKIKINGKNIGNITTISNSKDGNYFGLGVIKINVDNTTEIQIISNDKIITGKKLQ